jgi:hypothetical protein
VLRRYLLLSRSGMTVTAADLDPSNWGELSDDLAAVHVSAAPAGGLRRLEQAGGNACVLVYYGKVTDRDCFRASRINESTVAGADAALCGRWRSMVLGFAHM